MGKSQDINELETLGDRVWYMRKVVHQISLEKLAEKVSGISDRPYVWQTIQAIETGRVTNPGFLVQLAEALDVDVYWLLKGGEINLRYLQNESDYSGLKEKTRPPRANHIQTDAQTHTESTDDFLRSPVPVYGSDSRMTLKLDEDHIIEQFDRHPRQKGIDGAFWIVVTDNDMEPRFRIDDRLAIDPTRTATTGDDILVAYKDKTTTIRRLGGYDQENYQFIKLNGITSETVKKDLVEYLYVIVGTA